MQIFEFQKPPPPAAPALAAPRPRIILLLSRLSPVMGCRPPSRRRLVRFNLAVEHFAEVCRRAYKWPMRTPTLLLLGVLGQSTPGNVPPVRAAGTRFDYIVAKCI